MKALIRTMGGAAALTISATAALAEPCKQDSVPGTWTRASDSAEWTFAEDGSLTCEGAEACTDVFFGAPKNWRPIGELLLIGYDNASESYPCSLEGDSMTLGRWSFTR